jgi:hypothetical protein
MAYDEALEEVDALTRRDGRYAAAYDRSRLRIVPVGAPTAAEPEREALREALYTIASYDPDEVRRSGVTPTDVRDIARNALARALATPEAEGGST